MMLFFTSLQLLLLIFMLFHDWIPIPPFNDIEALKSTNGTFYRLLGSTINGVTVLIPLITSLIYYQQPSIPLHATITLVSVYLLLTIGTILSWWTPYLFGSSSKHKQAFSKFKNTHHFLPQKGDNIIPNTLHTVLHLLVWFCLALSIYFLLTTLHT